MAYFITFIAITSINWGAIVIKTPVNIDTITVQHVLHLMNKDRIQNGEALLKEDDYLDESAFFKANNMAVTQNFSHIDSRDNLTWKEMSLPTGTLWGENLARQFKTASDEETAWMSSPEHRVNILNQQFTKVGVGIENGYVAVEFTN